MKCSKQKSQNHKKNTFILMMPFHKKEKNIIWEKIGIQCVSQTYKRTDMVQNITSLGQ